MSKYPPRRLRGRKGINSAGEAIQDLALVIWIGTDGWSWLDIVKEIEAEMTRLG